MKGLNNMLAHKRFLLFTMFTAVYKARLFHVALPFNAEHSGGPSGTSGGRRPHTAAYCYVLSLAQSSSTV
jgi:hypothetical protein